MKKMLLALILAISFSLSNAQLTKGYWLVGGNGTISQQNQKLYGSVVKGTSIRLNPNLGYFLADKFAFGLKPGFEYSKIRKDGTLLDNGSSWSIGPFARYYFLPTDNVTNIFAETGYKHTWAKDGDADNLILFSGGPAFFFNTSVALELTANYSIFKFRNIENSAKTFFVAIGLQVHLEKTKA